MPASSQPLMPSVYDKSGKHGLREGFTTGTAASAAASAAFALLLGEEAAFRSVPVPPDLMNHAGQTPQTGDETRITVPIAGVKKLSPHSATAWIIKDGGDDPDATHGASIYAHLEIQDVMEAALVKEPSLVQEAALFKVNTVPCAPLTALILSCQDCPLIVELYAGEGVGIVTLPGLPVPVGEPAINPAPRRQIFAALAEVARAHHFFDNYSGRVRLTLSITNGETLALRTLNPRLGIVGGLSILGTHGTVRPYSHDAWAASIVEALRVAKAVGVNSAEANAAGIMLSTGRRSEKLLQALYPHLPATSFVQAADFVAFSLENAAELGFSRLTWGCFFGKLAKLAQGLPYTHAHEAPLDVNALADWCHSAGLSAAESLRQCRTANHALDIILAQPNALDVLQSLTLRAQSVAEGFVAARIAEIRQTSPMPMPEIRLHLFHLNGQELARA